MAVEVTSRIEKAWRPNSGKQALFASLPDTIFEAFYGGAAGGGKSAILRMLPILREWVNIKGFKGLILRRTFPELQESHIQVSKTGQLTKDGNETPSYYDFGATYNEQHKRWTFPSGATITFGHAEKEEDIRKYDSVEYQYIAPDELTSFTEFQYKFLFSRCRSSIPGLAAIIRSASNPGNIGHGWVRKRFVEPCREGGKIIAERIHIPDQGDVLIKRIFIQAFLQDNPHLMETDPMYRVKLEMLPEAEKKAKLYGDWWTFSGQVFDEWRTQNFFGEPSNANHVIPPQQFPIWLPRVLGVDWGFAAQAFVLWGIPFPDRTAKIYREFSAVKQTVKQWVTDVANICMLEGVLPRAIHLDPSAWQNRGDTPINEQFEKAWKDATGEKPKLEKAVNDRLGGKMLFHDYLRWKPLPKFQPLLSEAFSQQRADWIFRNVGVDAYKTYLKLFEPSEKSLPEILPRLQVTSNCTIFCETMPLCVYEKKEGKMSEDVAEFNGDDPYDTGRYLLQALDRFYSIVSREAETEVAKQDAIKILEETKDMTSFYRKMEHLEAKQANKNHTVVRLGRRHRRRVA